MREIENDQPALIFTNLRTVDRDLETITDQMLKFADFRTEHEKHALLFQNVVTVAHLC